MASLSLLYIIIYISFAFNCYVKLNNSLPSLMSRNPTRMMQKDKLRQDMFLIGPPGPLRRALVMKYAQLTEREQVVPMFLSYLHQGFV